MSRTELSFPSNPFSTRFVRPGALPYLFPAGADVAGLAERFLAGPGGAAVVGPHGSGKSTLLAALREPLERAGLCLHWVRLHDGRRWLPRASAEPARLGPQDVLIVDGYEQLSLLERLRIAWHRRRRRFRLLATAHQDVGLPVLWRTAVDPQTVERIVLALAGSWRPPLTPEAVAAARARHGSNVREVLFDLYDLLERAGAARRPNQT